MKVHLSRFICLDPVSNLHRMADEGARAAREGSELVVFPEAFLHGYTRRIPAPLARRAFAELSAAHPRAAFLFGSFTERRRNRLTVWKEGMELARYDKVHLFAPNGEFQIWRPGACYAAVRIHGWTVGLLNCNDLRFPEQARALRLEAQCDALVVIGWWPWRRDHVWRTLLQARAIENGVFVMGCCIAASETPEEPFAGAGNHVFDPLGDPVRTLDDHTYILDRHRLDALLVDPARGYVPVRRVRLFPAP